MLGLGVSSIVASTQEAGDVIGGRSSFTNTKSLSFDGVSDFAEFSANGNGNRDVFQSLLGAGSFTVSYWVKAADIVKGGNGNTVTLMNGVATGSGLVFLNLGVIYGPSHSQASLRDVIQFRYQRPEGTYFNTEADHSGVTLSDDTWIHIAYTSTINGSSRDGKVYINGSVLPNNSDSNSISGGDFSAKEEARFPLGATFFNASVSVFSEISLDEIAFYNTALTASQVSDIYNSGVPGDELAVHGNRVVGYWRLEDDGTDGSANSNDLTVTGATFSTSVPT